MSGALQEQRNPYKGIPLRAWLRLQLVARGGTARELDLMVDSGNPLPLIISSADFQLFARRPTSTANTNYGRLSGAWVRVLIPAVGFDDRVLGFSSDAVVASSKSSSQDFEGMAGLPFLRLFEYGGDNDWFWIRPQGSTP
jgi:hypothetical protein